jgi:hypothetical protein
VRQKQQNGEVLLSVARLAHNGELHIYEIDPEWMERLSFEEPKYD